MFLLIPQEQKKKLTKEYRLRLLFMCLAVLCVLGSLGTLAFLPAYFFVHSEENALLLRSTSIKGAINQKSDKDLEKTLLDVKQNIALLGTPDKDVRGTLDTILEAKPQGVSLTHFSYTYAPDEGSTILLQGISGDRGSLLQFSKNLKTIPEFKNVDLPIGNLAKNSEIDFNINISGNF